MFKIRLFVELISVVNKYDLNYNIVKKYDLNYNIVNKYNLNYIYV